MAKRYDLAVLGTGAAGSTIAAKCAEAGWTVAIVDSRPFGGTCALRGCDPKKVLVTGAALVDFARRMREKGVHDGSIALDWPGLIRFKREFTDPVPGNAQERYRKLGIDACHGRARFTGRTRIAVDGADGSVEIAARRIAVAAGQKPRPLDFPGADLLVTSTDFLDLARLPKRIAFVGGGYIGMEFAHVSARAGADVTVLNRGDRPLKGFDPFTVDALARASNAAGIAIRNQAVVKAVERRGGGFVMTADVAGVTESFPADLVVHGAGRVADIDDLDVEAGGVERDARGIVVNEFLRSPTNETVYAAGDCASSPAPRLTPIAGAEGRAVAENLLAGDHVRPDYAGTASVVFTIPPLAMAGLGEDEARRQGFDFRVSAGDSSGWANARRANERFGAYTVLVETGTGRILGAHLFGFGADEVINVFALAIRHRLTSDDLKATPFGYPTAGSDIGYMV